MKKYLMFLSVMVMSFIMSTGVAYASEVDAARNKTAVYLLDKYEKAFADVETYAIDAIMRLNMSNNYSTDEETIVNASLFAQVKMPDGIFMDMALYFPDEISESDSEELEGVYNLQFLMNNGSVYVREPGYMDWEFMGGSDMFGIDLTALQIQAESFVAINPEYNAFEEYVNSKYMYTKNAVIEGNEYYVISYEYDLKEFFEKYRGFAENLYLDMEEYMYEGYTTDIMAAYDSIFSMMDGKVYGEMYINTKTFIAEKMVLFFDMNLKMDTYGMPIEMYFNIDADIRFVDINVPIELPTVE